MTRTIQLALLPVLAVCACNPRPTNQDGAVTSSDQGVVVAGSYQGEVADWEQATHISVGEEFAEQLVLLASQQTTLPQETSSWLVRSYLYELRDLKAAQGEGINILTVDDASVFPFSRFADQAAFGKPVGFLRVVSDPSGADIWIDGVNRGTTVKEFVLSTGSHTVEVVSSTLRCQRELSITDQVEYLIECPGR